MNNPLMIIAVFFGIGVTACIAAFIAAAVIILRECIRIRQETRHKKGTKLL